MTGMRPVVGPGVRYGPGETVPGTGPDRLRGWRALVLAPVGNGQRYRRGTDGMRLACAVLALVCCLLIIRYNSLIDRSIVAVIHPPPWSIVWLVTVAYQVGSFGVVVVAAALSLLARRWEMARDILVSAAIAAAVSGVLVLLIGGRGGRPGGVVVNSYSLTFPVIRIALFAAVAVAALPYLARGLQRAIEVFVVVVSLASAVGGHGLPLNVLGSLAIGWGAAVTVRLIFGSPLGLPSGDDVRRLLAEVGVLVSDVHPVARQVWGVAKYAATETFPAGSTGLLAIAVYGRDAADARLLTKLGRFLFYRDSGPSLTLTRLQQVEREAYLTLRAGQKGVAVPEIIEAGTAGPAKDALLAWRLPAGVALADANGASVSDAALDDIYRQLLTLRAARIAHGAVSGDTLLVDVETQTVVLTDFRNATGSAAHDQLDRDLAGAIAATALSAGTERAAACAVRRLDPALLGTALRHLHRQALDPAIGRHLRGAGKRGLLEDVRERAALGASIDAPRLVQPRRVSWPTLILTVGTLIGGWALVGVLIDVSRSFDTVIGADWLWVAVALVLAQLAYVASAVETMGSVAGPLAFGRVLALEVANAFSGLAGGAAAGHATRARFFQLQGYSISVALSSGAIITTASWIAIVVLFLPSLPFAWGAINLDVSPETGGHAELVWTILAVVVAVAVLAGLALAVPRVRRLASQKMLPKVQSVWTNLRQVAGSPSKLMMLVGGSLAQRLLVVMALSVSLRAFGDHVTLPVLLVVITLAAFVGGVAPSPGGMGVVEAGMILGLTAAGVSEADATAAVFVQRLFTSYLPPIWGWFTLAWMRRRELL
ncbi:MAG: lysylphosphatidylglycerol synthase domain-containing protein [Trebonia sp.]